MAWLASKNRFVKSSRTAYRGRDEMLSIEWRGSHWDGTAERNTSATALISFRRRCVAEVIRLHLHLHAAASVRRLLGHCLNSSRHWCTQKQPRRQQQQRNAMLQVCNSGPVVQEICRYIFILFILANWTMRIKTQCAQCAWFTKGMQPTYTWPLKHQ